MEFISTNVFVPQYLQYIDYNSNLFGFKNITDAEDWCYRSCGIVSLKMVMDAIKIKQGKKITPLQGELVYQGLKLGAHSEKGWLYKGLLDLAREYQIEGELHKIISVHEVTEKLREKKLCIVSVTPRFEGGEKKEDGSIKSPGGHLVVLKGVELLNNKPISFNVNDPLKNSSEYFVKKEPFVKSFACRCMTFDVNQ